jgi:branched-chain amino acid transport system permease protein
MTLEKSQEKPVAATGQEPGTGSGLPQRLLGSTLVRHVLFAVIALIVLDRVSAYASPFRNSQIASTLIFACAAGGLTLLTGTSGQISLGHGAFMATGAYCFALVLQDLQWPLVAVLLASTVITAMLGVLAGAAAARLRGPYLAGATLALAVGLPSLATWSHLRTTLGGANGLTVVSPGPPAALGANFTLDRWQVEVCGVATVVTFLVLANLGRSRYGRAWRAIRDDEVSASLAGLPVARMQVLAFVVSSACAGLAGGLYAFFNGLAAPGAFPLALSLQLLAAAVLGGLGSLAGAVYGSALLVLLPTWSSDIAGNLHLSQNVYANLPLMAYGILLVVVMLAFPQGIQGLVRRLVAGVRRRWQQRRAAGGAPPTQSSPARSR